MKNNGNGTFAAPVALTNSDSGYNEGDFFDYDLDGDLDLFIANFSGQERVYQNDGTGNFTYQNTNVVLPPDGTTSLDADAADVDNDGDPDVFVANDANQPEWYLRNNTTANDTHAPRLFHLEQAPNRAPSATPTVVRVQVEDNQPYYGTWYIPVHLEVSVDGGPTTNYPMRTSMGQIFRGEIPGALAGVISYHVVAADQYGNTGTSNSRIYLPQGTSPMASFCSPGDSRVVACACDNPPSIVGRGCNNFAAFSGGAILSAAGTPSLGADTLVFTASGENATAFTIVVQGTTSNPTGFVFGAGVRCARGILKRLYTGSAPGGSNPPPGRADPSVSARSAAPGTTIQPCDPRHYITSNPHPARCSP